MKGRSLRQSFLGAGSDEALQHIEVGIVGLGGGGSQIAQQLAHLGVGQFVLIDPDRIEESNLNRLVGGTFADASKNEWKVEIARRLIRSVNPDASVTVAKDRWQQRGDLIKTCDILFGCVDSFAGRDELEKAARRYLTPYIDIGMDVHQEKDGTYSISGQVALSMPGEACLHCMNVLRPELIAQEAAQYGAAGPRPQVVWSNGVLASVAVGIMVQLVTPWHDHHNSLLLLEYDGNSSEVRVGSAVSFLRGKVCQHFGDVASLGDPWFGQMSPPEVV